MPNPGKPELDGGEGAHFRYRAIEARLERKSSVRAGLFMQFDTKIAVVIRTDLEAWQKLNVACFLAGGIAAAFPQCVGEVYEDGSGTEYLPLIGQPILIYGADRPQLSRALERALSRNVTAALYTEDMFATTHDAANRAAVKAVARADLNLVGLAMRAERKVIDKIVDGLKFHG